MALRLPNLPIITKAAPKLGEALNKAQQYINSNTTQAAGNKKSAPSFVNPNRPAGQ